MESGEVSDPYRYCLKASVSSICNEVGFDAAEPAAIETLTELLTSLLIEIGRSTRQFCELAGRVEPIIADLILAMVELGVPITGLNEFARRRTAKAVTTPGQAPEVKQPTILHTGNKKRHPGHIPEYMPELPDSHSYIHTPTHRQPITDYESVREKAASQKRDVERALTRFIAKTGKIHNLFNTDDTNLFPLISCVKGEDEYKLPPYVDALIFKDQIFEDDPEMERRTRKKRSFEQLSTQAPDGTGDESDDENDPILGGGGGSNNGSGLPLPDLNTSRLNESLTETDLSDNPFLRPVRLPRTPKKQRD